MVRIFVREGAPRSFPESRRAAALSTAETSTERSSTLLTIKTLYYSPIRWRMDANRTVRRVPHLKSTMARGYRRYKVVFIVFGDRPWSGLWRHVAVHVALFCWVSELDGGVGNV